MKLKQKIVEIHHRSRRTYGSPRIYRKLLREGYQVGKKRVERLMQEAGIFAVSKKKYRATTDSKHSQPAAANHLNRTFRADRPNPRRLALSINHHGPVFPENHRLVPEKANNERISYCSITYGH